jgi:cytochrome c biogenesis protein CcmG/thiol:disulfide interchange protein DsbE
MTRRGIDPAMTATAGDPVATVAARSAGRLPRRYYLGAALVPILLLVAWGAILLARPAPDGVARIGDPAPGFVLNDLDGNPVRLADLRGRPVIVNFWASWCIPCVEEFPVLAKAAKAHQGEGLAVVGIVYRDQSDPAREFMDRMAATWPALMDPGDTVASRFGVIGAPDTFFIDRDGTLVSRQIGQLTAADMQRGLARILGEER